MKFSVKKYGEDGAFQMAMDARSTALGKLVGALPRKPMTLCSTAPARCVISLAARREKTGSRRLVYSRNRALQGETACIGNRNNL